MSSPSRPERGGARSVRAEWLVCGTAPEWREGAHGTGGSAYGALARRALAGEHQVRVRYVPRGAAAPRLARLGEWIATVRRLRALRFEGEVVVRDYLGAAFAPFDAARRHIVLLHHLETFPSPYAPLWRWLNGRVCRRARRADRVVVVSRFWQQELERRGLERVEVVPNAFDVDGCEFDGAELESLRSTLALPRDRPLVYLGSARPEKGFRQAHAALAGLEAEFVVSGPGAAEPPVRRLDLPYRDYLKLLRLADLTVTMSTFDEGWCRTAHEAMLCGTPVVGSGRGGMAELLREGGQVICPRFEGLRPIVRSLLADPERRRALGERGRLYARRFDLEPFSRRWCGLVRSLGDPPPAKS